MKIKSFRPTFKIWELARCRHFLNLDYVVQIQLSLLFLFFHVRSSLLKSQVCLLMTHLYICHFLLLFSLCLSFIIIFFLSFLYHLFLSVLFSFSFCHSFVLVICLSIIFFMCSFLLLFFSVLLFSYFFCLFYNFLSVFLQSFRPSFHPFFYCLSLPFFSLSMRPQLQRGQFMVGRELEVCSSCSIQRVIEKLSVT